MARSATTPRRKERGEIEPLPSGSFRVRVYVGIDPVTRKRTYLTETVPAGPRAEATAQKVLTRFLAEVDERRAPRTKQTVAQLMDRYLAVVRVEPTTMARYEHSVRIHIRPLLGHLAVGRLDGEALDSFDIELRRCRTHCRGRRQVDHRIGGEHDCDRRCRPHRCRGLSESSIRKIHFVLSAAYKVAIRWKWVSVNPMAQASTPRSRRPKPTPPAAEQAARISQAAWSDVEWGLFVWLTMVTGPRRGEVCALHWDDFDPVKRTLAIDSSIAQLDGRIWEKATKNDQQRVIALDELTVGLLAAYRRLVEAEAAPIGLAIPSGSYIFSSSPDHSTPRNPRSQSQRYKRMCARLGWNMHLHELRHYSATELIAAGVDLRTVAGRLGHSDGGATTLRVYSAWRPEADVRAAGTIASGLPRPAALDVAAASFLAAVRLAPEPEPTTPYQRIAADLAGAIRCGALKPGDVLPTVVDLADRYTVAPSTAHRAIAELSAAGSVRASRGKRATVA